MSVSYHYEDNSHSPTSALAGMSHLLSQHQAQSLLDVGCGVGTWMRAALDAGVQDVKGVDGVQVEGGLHVPCELRQVADLTKEWSAGRRFDLVLCFEVAEHLPESAASTLIRTLTDHADTVCFSAACPGQPGEQHLNCQWPRWWQGLFNECGFTCEDSLRWRWWSDSRIEPWYRQNAFTARRDVKAGQEPRLPAVIHPEMITALMAGQGAEFFETHRAQIEAGRLPWVWNLTLPFRAASAKIRRWLRSR